MCRLRLPRPSTSRCACFKAFPKLNTLRRTCTWFNLKPRNDRFLHWTVICCTYVLRMIKVELGHITEINNYRYPLRSSNTSYMVSICKYRFHFMEVLQSAYLFYMYNRLIFTQNLIHLQLHVVNINIWK